MQCPRGIRRQAPARPDPPRAHFKSTANLDLAGESDGARPTLRAYLQLYHGQFSKNLDDCFGSRSPSGKDRRAGQRRQGMLVPSWGHPQTIGAPYREAVKGMPMPPERRFLSPHESTLKYFPK